MRKPVRIPAILIASLLSSIAFISNALATSLLLNPDQGKSPAKESEDKGNSNHGPVKDTNFFTNLGIGGAVGWTHNLGRTRVETATAPNGIVRIDEDKNNLARLWVETHTWVHEWGDTGDKDKRRWGTGPFVGVAVGSNFVDAVGAGWMIGRRYGTTNTSFNFAIGGALELNAKVLGTELKRIGRFQLVKQPFERELHQLEVYSHYFL